MGSEIFGFKTYCGGRADVRKKRLIEGAFRSLKTYNGVFLGTVTPSKKTTSLKKSSGICYKSKFTSKMCKVN